MFVGIVFKLESDFAFMDESVYCPQYLVDLELVVDIFLAEYLDLWDYFEIELIVMESMVGLEIDQLSDFVL